MHLRGRASLHSHSLVGDTYKRGVSARGLPAQLENNPNPWGRDRDSAHNNCAGFACLAGIYTRKD